MSVLGRDTGPVERRTSIGVDAADETAHIVHFYDGDDALAALACEFIAGGVAAGEPVVIIATAEHRKSFVARLVDRGLAVEELERDGRLLLADARETLARFMVDGMPDGARFQAEVGALLPALRPGGRARAYGEMVDVLWREQNPQAALRLEELWNELQATRSFTLLCAYAMGSFYKEAAGLNQVCSGHTHVRVGDTIDEAQHARALAAEIADRKQIERALRDSLRALRDRDAALEAHQGRLQIITDSLPFLVSYVDRDLRYQFVSHTYERWFGVPVSEVVGRHVRDVLGESAFAAVEPRLRAALAGTTQTFQTRLEYRLGGARVVEATYVPHRGASGEIEGYVGLIADISVRARDEQAREAQARRAERLSRVTTAIADAVTREQVFAAIVDHVGETLHASSAGLWLLSDDARRIDLVRSLGYTEAGRRSMTSLELDGPVRMPIIDAVRSGQQVWLDSQADLLERYPQLASLVTAGRDYQIACLPMVVQGETLGAVGFTFDQRSDEEQRSFLDLVARYSGQALERLRLLEVERLTRARAEATALRMAVLSRASRAFSEARDDLGALLQAVVEQVTRDHADACAVMLVADDGVRIDLAAVQTRDPSAAASARAMVTATPMRVGEGMTGRVVATGEAFFQPIIDPQAMLGAAYAPYREWVADNLPHSVIAVPLRAGGHIIGSMVCSRQGDSPSFQEADLHFLEELGERAALAIESSRLALANRRGRDRAEMLYLLARAVIAADRVEQVYDAALDALGRALGARRASILVFDADGVMRFEAWRGLSEAYRRAVEGHSPWAPGTRDAQPIVVPDVEADPAWAAYLPRFRDEGIAALAFIPLVAGGKLLGKFMVYYERPRALAAEELDLARAIADHVAAAVDRFTTMGELQETIRFNEMFTAILGHDLRNPLGAIIAAAQLAIMRGENEKLIKPLSRILVSGERMARMISQLLDFTRVRVGSGIPISLAPLDVVPLVRQVLDELDDANPDWTLRLEEAGDTSGVWDADRLSQVFSNLVANAVQHGDVEHGVRVLIDGTLTDLVRVEVHNRGAIPAARLPRLFEPLAGGERRLEKSRGLGLGLYISREIVRSHGGTIDVHSDEATGTRFVVVLPRIGRMGNA